MVGGLRVLIATHPVRNLIREGRSNQLQNVMFTNQKEGMQTLENSLAALVVEKRHHVRRRDVDHGSPEGIDPHPRAIGQEPYSGINDS